jgi:hypothetical protein
LLIALIVAEILKGNLIMPARQLMLKAVWVLTIAFSVTTLLADNGIIVAEYGLRCFIIWQCSIVIEKTTPDIRFG